VRVFWPGFFYTGRPNCGVNVVNDLAAKVDIGTTLAGHVDQRRKKEVEGILITSKAIMSLREAGFGPVEIIRLLRRFVSGIEKVVNIGNVPQELRRRAIVPITRPVLGSIRQQGEAAPNAPKRRWSRLS
jgi:hypothetical protein